MLDLARLRAAYEKVRDELLAARTPEGHWVGELSSSALATATAVSALAVVRRTVQSPKSKVQSSGGSNSSTLDLGPWTLDSRPLNDLICRGVAWLVAQQNDDGGFGDTDLSHSNIATTFLVVAALHLAGVAEQNAELISRANAYIDAKGRLEGLRKRYGIDKTFVVPIMTNLALAGLVEWREIDPLPFELACVPQSLYRFVGMPVVSYAIPALVAIGQAHYFRVSPRNLITRLIRWLCVERSLRVLRQMQPESGGYLEATPLTSFVVMSLASCSPPLRSGPPATESRATIAKEVIVEGVKFLISSARPDGSWPIDTNLATWNTTLAINALAGAGEDVAALLGPKCLDWLLTCQHTRRDPFTGADPGGFGWSDLSGAVPDADDTPGAMLTLRSWKHSVGPRIDEGEKIDVALRGASRWLLGLMNRDGGWPTFCRGWGRLPFDRSGSDLTAHALRALSLWPDEFDDHYEWTTFLWTSQHPDGSWSPLWFGNQDHPTEDNPVYGTAKVLMAYRDLRLMDSPEARRGVAWLVANQNADGGWGSGVWEKAVRKAESGKRKAAAEEIAAKREEAARLESDGGSDAVPGTQYSVPSTENEQARSRNIGSPQGGPPAAPAVPAPRSPAIDAPRSPSNLKSSLEETALAVEALLAARDDPAAAAAVARGLDWLVERVERGEHRQPAPIGFYFAKLWYYERLYPLTFSVAALGRACREFVGPVQPDSHAQPPPSDAP